MRNHLPIAQYFLNNFNQEIVDYSERLLRLCVTTHQSHMFELLMNSPEIATKLDNIEFLTSLSTHILLKDKNNDDEYLQKQYILNTIIKHQYNNVQFQQFLQPKHNKLIVTSTESLDQKLLDYAYKKLLTYQLEQRLSPKEEEGHRRKHKNKI